MDGEVRPTCQMCGKPLTANARGQYVDCCARYVTPPKPRRPLGSMFDAWARGAECMLFGSGGRMSTRRRLGLFTLGTLILALPCVIPACTGLF